MDPNGSTDWTLSQRSADALEVYLLGLVDFDSALFLQERLVYDISGRNDAKGGLLICEHPPLATLGREGSREHLLSEPVDFQARRIDVRWLNRGGGCLMHAPGQLAVYPIIPLNRLGLGLIEYRRCLEQAVIETCEELKVPAERDADSTGVWCRGGQIAAVGLAVKHWIAYHGMFINVRPRLELQRMVMSNTQGGSMTSLEMQRSRMTPMHAVRSVLVERLAAALGYEKFHLYTGHPLLRRTQRKVYDYA